MDNDILVHVHVSGEPTSDEDVGIPGTYEIEVRSGTPSDMIGEVALSVFHGKIGIAVLDDLEITAERVDGKPLEDWTGSPLDADAERMGLFVGKISD